MRKVQRDPGAQGLEAGTLCVPLAPGSTLETARQDLTPFLGTEQAGKVGDHAPRGSPDPVAPPTPAYPDLTSSGSHLSFFLAPSFCSLRSSVLAVGSYQPQAIFSLSDARLCPQENSLKTEDLFNVHLHY